MSSAHINDLVNKRSGEIVYGTCQIQIVKIRTDTDGTLFFIHGKRIRNPSGVRNGVNEASCAQLLYLSFDRGGFGRMDRSLLLAYRGHIGPCVDVVFHDGWIQRGHFSVRPSKDVMELLEESFVGSDFL